MTRIAPLFVLALSLLLAGCFPQSGTLTPSDPSSVVTDPPAPITFSVHFDGDTAAWPLTTVACGGEVFSSEFDDEGWAYFSQSCETTYFNVASGELNINPYLLAEIGIDEGSDVIEQEGLPDLEPILRLWVFTGQYEWGISEMLDPLTVNDPNGSFWGCDEPQWNEPYGMPYGRPPAVYDDRCETSD